MQKLAEGGEKGQWSSRRSWRNGDGFILEVKTLASSLMQDSKSDSARAAIANYTNRQPLFPDVESPICK
jgi:hypothetical protein